MDAVSSPLAPPRMPDHTSVIGWILFVVTSLAVVVMAHHPTVTASDTAEALRDIGDFSRLSALVHGTLIALLLVTFFGLSEFIARRGWSRPWIRIGTIAYGAGLVVMLGAALVSGFVITDVATMMPHETAVDLQVDRQLLVFCRILNQTCADFASSPCRSASVSGRSTCCANVGRCA